jgi:hypothetical protein
MAIGPFGSKKGDARSLSNSSSNEKKDPELGGLAASDRRDMDDDSTASMTVGKQMEMEAENAIKYRTCSWQKTAALLFSEYICLAIMSFPWSYSILGLVPGLILTAVIAGLVLYTSLITWCVSQGNSNSESHFNTAQGVLYAPP